MRVGCRCEWNTLFHRQFNDSVTGIKFVHRLTPACCGKLNRQIPRANNIERFRHNRINICLWTMAVDFDKIEMRQAIDQPSRSDFADAAKVIGIKGIDIASLELLGTDRNAVEHLITAIEEMNRAQHKLHL